MFNKLKKPTTIVSGIFGAIFAIWLINLISYKQEDKDGNKSISPNDILSLAIELIKTIRNFLNKIDNR